MFEQGWLLAALLVIAALLTWKTFHYLSYYRLITGTPTARIRSAHQGYVEIMGHIIDGEQEELTAPLSGRPCVWYSYKVFALNGDGNSRNWVVERSGTSDAWFQVNDDTATCLIDPEGATVRTNNTRTWHGSTAYPDTLRQQDHSIQLAHLLAGKGSDGRRYRYQETLLFNHERLYALGEFRSTGGGRHVDNLQQLKGEIIREWKLSFDELLQRFDENGNEKLDMTEWANVEAAATEEAQRRQNAQQQAPTMHVLTQPTDKQQPFILSTLDEEALAKRYGAYALACIAGLIVCGYLFYRLFP